MPENINICTSGRKTLNRENTVEVLNEVLRDVLSYWSRETSVTRILAIRKYLGLNERVNQKLI